MSNREEAERLALLPRIGLIEEALAAAEHRGRNAGIEDCIAKLNSWIEHHARASVRTGILELARNDLVRLSDALLSNPATPEGEVVKACVFCKHDFPHTRFTGTHGCTFAGCECSAREGRQP